MSHSHDHGAASLSDGRLVVAVAVNVLLTVAQVIGGLAAGSLALIADALHNLNDAASLALALFARRIARTPADNRRTFGYRRAELVGALINLTAMVIVGLFLIYEALERWFDPRPIDGWIVVIVAGVALAVDVATALLTRAMARGSLNVRAAFVHNLADALASLGVIVAGTLIILRGWYVADLVITLAVSAYILIQGVTLMRQTIRVLMDSVPLDVDLRRVVQAMETVTGVQEVHHLHAWELDEHHRALEAHVVVARRDLDTMESIKHELKDRLRERFGIGHATLELELEEERRCARPGACHLPAGGGVHAHAANKEEPLP